MKLEVTEKGVFAVVDGKEQEVKVGKIIDIDVNVDTIPTPLRNKVRVIAEASETAEHVTNTEPPSVAYEVASKDRGWFVVEVDGVEVTKNLREEHIAGFDALTDEEKADFVTQNAKED